MREEKHDGESASLEGQDAAQFFARTISDSEGDSEVVDGERAEAEKKEEDFADPEGQDAAQILARKSFDREGDSKVVYGEGVGITASMMILASISTAIGGNTEEIREQRKFAEGKPRVFQEGGELHENSGNLQRRFEQIVEMV